MNRIFSACIVLFFTVLTACSEDSKALSIDAFYAERSTCHTGEPVRVYLRLANAPETVSNHFTFVQGAGIISNEGMSAVITLTNAGYARIKVIASTPDGSAVSDVVGIIGKNYSPELLSWTANTTSVAKGNDINFTVSATDRDWDTLTCSYRLDPDIGSVVVSNMTAVYTAPADWSGKVMVTLTLKDSGVSIQRSMEITVEKSWMFLERVYKHPRNWGGSQKFTACDGPGGSFYLGFYGYDWTGYSVNRLMTCGSGGTNWSDTGILGPSAYSSFWLKSNSQGQVYSSKVTTNSVQVYRLHDGAWEMAGPELSKDPGDSLKTRMLIVSEDGVPMIGLVYETNRSKQIFYLNGGVWNPLTPIPSDGIDLKITRLNDGSMWASFVTNDSTLLVCWNGSSWTEVSLPGTGDMTMQTVKGDLWVTQNNAFYKWNGTGWDQVFIGTPGILAIGEDGAYHVFNRYINGHYGYTIRNGEVKYYSQGAIYSRCSFQHIFARGNPSKPYLIYQNIPDNSFNIAEGR